MWPVKSGVFGHMAKVSADTPIEFCRSGQAEKTAGNCICGQRLFRWKPRKGCGVVIRKVTPHDPARTAAVPRRLTQGRPCYPLCTNSRVERPWPQLLARATYPLRFIPRHYGLAMSDADSTVSLLRVRRILTHFQSLLLLQFRYPEKPSRHLHSHQIERYPHS